MDDDDLVKDAAREIAGAARAVATGVAVAARAKAEPQASRISGAARRLEPQAGATGAWRGVETRERSQDIEAQLAVRRREAQREKETAERG